MLEDQSFKIWFKQRRKYLDLTQEELAAQVNCSLATIRGIERGALRPSRELAQLLAARLQVPPTERDAFVRWARSAIPREEVLPNYPNGNAAPDDGPRIRTTGSPGHL